MSQLQLKRTDLVVTLDDEKYILRKPSVTEMESFGEQIKNMQDEDSNSIKIMKDLIVSLGMPAEVLGGMEFDHFNMLCEYVSGAKKN